ncbi:MAG: recombinase family protein [Planctomycetota bacterium]
MLRLKNPLVPRNGHTLVVGIVARISGGQNQREMTLDDQVDHAKAEVAEIYSGAVEYRVISTTGKGERLDRPELHNIESMIRSRELDLLVAEDLGRIVRGTEASWICGLAVDHGTRVIVPNDGIDTADEAWEEDVISACRDHVGHNVHTSKRLKHKLMNRFRKHGQAMAREIFGYIVADNAKSYWDWKKDESVTVIFITWFGMLKEGQSYCAVADWLNQNNVPVGPYARSRTKWDGTTVRRLTMNPLLKGMPGRGFKKSIKHHETGRRVSVKNPDGPVLIDCPHLAHVPPDLWDEVNALIRERNKGMGRKPVNNQDPRKGMPKKRTVWPGQHLTCGVCNRIYYWGGHGVTEHMMCRGCHEYRCWNGATFDGHDAGQRILQATLEKIASLDGFDETLMSKVHERIKARSSNRESEIRKVTDELRQLEKQKANIVDAITQIGLNDDFRKRLDELDAKLRATQFRLSRMNDDKDQPLALPTLAEIKQRARSLLGSPLTSDPAFCTAMHRLVPSIVVYPHQLCDGGAIVLRARVSLDLTPLFEGAAWAIEDDKVLRIDFMVDLFDKPQRAAFLLDVLRLKAEGLKEREIATRLGITQPAVQYAKALHRKMKQLGITDPYIQLNEPPKEGWKLKRHLNPRYRFEPRDDGSSGPPAL